MTARPTLVFLDIDGVLLPFGDGVAAIEPPAILSDGCLGALSQLLAAPLPGGAAAEVVLSSTWRARPAFINDILADFRRYGAAHPTSPLATLGATQHFYDTTSVNVFGPRQHEIAVWLERRTARGEVAPAAWVCLDDEELLIGKACATRREVFEGHVVQTLSDVGLTASLADRGVELLRSQLTGEPSGTGCANVPSVERKRSLEPGDDAAAVGGLAASEETPPCLVVGCIQCDRDCHTGGVGEGDTGRDDVDCELPELRARFGCPQALSGQCELVICEECAVASGAAAPITCRDHDEECVNLQWAG